MRYAPRQESPTNRPMTAVTFDTHAFIKRLVAAGMPEAQAEAVTALVREVQDGNSTDAATKGDLVRVETLLRSDIREETAPIKAELPLMKWMVGFVLAFQIALFVKLFVH